MLYLRSLLDKGCLDLTASVWKLRLIMGSSCSISTTEATLEKRRVLVLRGAIGVVKSIPTTVLRALLDVGT